MTPRELTEVQRGLDALPDILRITTRLLADLHSLAYDKHVGERTLSTGHKLAWYLDDTGQQKAKDAFRDIARTSVALETACQAALNLLAAGPSADTTLRGTLLGDDHGNHAEHEMGRLVKAQQRRQQRAPVTGEYVSAASERQPKVPKR